MDQTMIESQQCQEQKSFKDYDRLPLELQRLIFTFCDVTTVCSILQRTSRNVGIIARALIAQPQTQDNLPHAFQDPILTARYEHLCKLRSLYHDLESTREDATGITAVQVKEWYTAPTDKMRKLILPSELGDFLRLDPLDAIDAKEYDFPTFVSVFDHIQTTLNARREHLLEHFTPADPDAPRDIREGQLTVRGKQVCDTYFDFFDRDNDGALKFEELSALNSAAGLALSQGGFEWVQTSFECNNEGSLTKRGYEEMFLDNCRRVPDLMHKDLVLLTKYLREHADEDQNESEQVGDDEIMEGAAAATGSTSSTGAYGNLASRGHRGSMDSQASNGTDFMWALPEVEEGDDYDIELDDDEDEEDWSADMDLLSQEIAPMEAD